MKKKKRKPAEEPLEQGGKDKGEADEWQYMWIDSLGFQPVDRQGHMTKDKARRMIRLLKSGWDFEAVAKACYVRKFFSVPPSYKQQGFARYKGVPIERARCRRDATLLIDAVLEPTKFYNERLKEADKAKRAEDFDLLSHDLLLVHDVLPAEHFGPLLAECDAVWRKWLATGEGGIPE